MKYNTKDETKKKDKEIICLAIEFKILCINNHWQGKYKSEP